MANQVAPPTRVQYRYGLLSLPGIIENKGSLRLVADYTFDSVACNTGIVWEPACGPVFTVTFTKSATADTFNVTVDVGVVGDYEVSVNGAGFVALTATVVSTDPTPTPVIVREVAAPHRSVSRADINFDSAQGTVFTFVSQQTNNDPKEFTEGIGSPSGSPFVVIGGAACTPIADYDWEALGTQALQAVEGPLVERRFWDIQLANSTPTLPVAATPQTVVDGVALLEEYARATTGFEATLHVSSYLGAHLAAADIITETATETIKRTALHTPLVLGGGYTRNGPTGQAAASPTQAWMYATGSLVVQRGVPFIPGSEAERFNQINNQTFVMAERTYVVIADCPIAAVLVDTSI